jgi:hypothetical protein
LEAAVRSGQEQETHKTPVNQWDKEWKCPRQSLWHYANIAAVGDKCHHTYSTERKSEVLRRCGNLYKDAEQVRNCVRCPKPWTFISTLITNAKELPLSLENYKQRTWAE